MAHFAKLDNDNVVIGVHVIANDILNINEIESEQAGVDFLTNLHGHSKWKQTSYNGNFRKNYAAPGMIYDESRDAFIELQLYPSWTLNEDTCQWEPPIPYPIDGKLYTWNESEMSWIEFTRNNIEITDTQSNLETGAVSRES